MRKSISLSIIFSLIFSFVFSALPPIQPEALAQNLRVNDEATAKKSRKPRGQSLLVSNRPVFDAWGQTGYQQTIRVAGKPSKKDFGPEYLTPFAPFGNKKLGQFTDVFTGFSDPQRLDCTAEATVTVLANEITYGETGPHIPTRLDCLMSGSGGSSTYGLFNGGDITVGMSQVVSLEPGAELSLIGRTGYPDFEAPYPSTVFSIPNSDAVNAAILLNGSNYFTIAIQKGIQNPFGGQLALESILGSIVDWDTGVVTLPDNEMIVLYELGSSHPGSLSFDFNDLVVRVSTQCANSGEVVIRDSIGEGSESTDGNRMFNNTISSGWYQVPIKVEPTENVKLKKFRVIAAQMGSSVNWNNFDFIVRIWDSEAALNAAPVLGNVVNNIVDTPVNGFTAFGYAATPSLGYKPSWDLEFDLLPYNVTVPAGSTYFVAVHFWSTTGTGGSGVVGIVESTESGPTDYMYSSFGPPVPIDSYDASHHYGRLGVTITAESAD